MLKKRNLLFLSLLILGILLLSSCFLNPPVTEGILKGQIMVPEGTIQAKDLTGQALPDATVNIIDLTTGEIIATTVTDADGHYQVFVPPGGPYLLEAAKDGVKLQQITPSVEVGIEYDLGTADCTTTAIALIVQAMLDAGADLADINLADIESDPDFDDVLSSVTSIIEAGGDPTTSAAIEEAVEDFLNPTAPPPPPTPSPTTYTVTFDSQGGSAVSSQTVEEGAKATEPTAPTKTGHTFGGWYKESGCINTWVFDIDTVIADVTLYARWTVNTYTVTFDKNGGDTEAIPITKPATHGGNVGTLPTAPTRTGYNFDSWNINADGTGGGFTATTVVTADITVYAQWTSQLDRYVGKTNASDDVSHGTTADTPWQTIQYALDETPNGGTIYVADGTYTGKITFPSTLDIDGGRVLILKSENGADNTKIREIYNSGDFIVTLDSCPDGTILDGFTITTEETATKSTGGIFIKYCSPTIQNNTISGNTATVDGGGGIYSHFSSPVIQDNTISGNETTAPGLSEGWGGGIYIYYDFDPFSPIIQNNTISGNTTARGGGIYTFYGSPIIQNNEISGNTVTYIGGGIYIGHGTSSSKIYNNTISGNTAGSAGGINIYDGSPKIYNNTISGNTVTGDGGAISVIYGSPTIGGVDVTDTINFNNICGNTSNQISPDSYPFNYIFINCDVIGETGPAGGLIFYDKGSVSDGWRYLEAHPSDQSTSYVWNGSGIVGGTSADIGTGEANTNAIVGQSAGNADSAAKLCYELEFNGYNDWFLPSTDELNLMYTNLKVAGKGSFSDSPYWSSTEESELFAWYQYFGTGHADNGNKNDLNYVRAIRSF